MQMMMNFQLARGIISW